eukprot:maker-scaffold_8-snap-gene-0.32-mRNA-1 protein AED:0.22 eAED:0.22 QI:79/1/1/1/0.6/0.33/6/253/612
MGHPNFFSNRKRRNISNKRKINSVIFLLPITVLFYVLFSLMYSMQVLKESDLTSQQNEDVISKQKSSDDVDDVVEKRQDVSSKPDSAWHYVYNPSATAARSGHVQMEWAEGNSIQSFSNFENYLLLPEEEFASGNLPDSNEEIENFSVKLASQTKIKVKAMMKFAYGNYESRAFGSDELKPVSGKGDNPWGSHGVTLIDSLDTLWILGMKDEFYRARNWVRDNLDYEKVGVVSFFETTIRDLGGLLSAYYLSEDSVFLQKAHDLGLRLIKAFKNFNVPMGKVVLSNRKLSKLRAPMGDTFLAEVGSCQLEFIALSNLTGDAQFEKAAMKAIKFLEKKTKSKDGLFPTHINPKTGKSRMYLYTLGACSDSFYEYLLKVFVQGGHYGELSKNRYNNAVEGIIKHLLYNSQPTGLLYVRDMHRIPHTFSRTRNEYSSKISHLTCFAPGMFALGSYYNTDEQQNEKTLLIAKKMMYTCYQLYERSVSGLSPEYVTLTRAEQIEQEIFVKEGADDVYVLRPETIESLFILYYITKNPIYRVWGKKILNSIEMHSKTHYGYSSVKRVSTDKPGAIDKMESFFLAETLKYLYLLFDDDPIVDLDDWVFNTEAHPFKRFY